MKNETRRQARRLKQQSEDAQAEGHWNRADGLRQRLWREQAAMDELVAEFRPVMAALETEYGRYVSPRLPLR